MQKSIILPDEVSGILLSNAISSNFSGPDPFDHLNSRIFQKTPFNQNKFSRLIFLQLGKLSLIDFRSLLRVPLMRNPKGIGLFILGLVQDYRRTTDSSYIQLATSLADWLLSEQSNPKEWSHACWGYHFDWQARAFYVPAGKPNIITTCYVARALHELGQITSNQNLVDTALDTAHFISSNLYTEVEGRSFYAYIPGEKAFVHNANLWGAAWCAFAGKQLGEKTLVEQALRAANQSVMEQNPDGSWVYGARHHHQFIDGFHTGYNLEALCLLRNTLETSEFDECIRRGYSYYLDKLITEDGAAKYYNNKLYPLDMHSFAQAIFTLLKVGDTAKDLALCDKVVRQAIKSLYIPSKGQFIYQKTRWLTNSINYTRWTHAWAYYSLAFYNRYCAEAKYAED